MRLNDTFGGGGPVVVVVVLALRRRELLVVVNRVGCVACEAGMGSGSLARLRLEWQVCGECDWQVEMVPGGMFQTHSSFKNALK